MNKNIKITDKTGLKVNKKKSLTIFSWFYFLLSLIVSTFIPEVRDFFSLGIIGEFKRALCYDYRLTFGLFGFLILIFLLMYFIDFLRVKFLKNYSPSPNKTLNELKKVLPGLWLMLESWRFYAIIIGTIILLASIFGIEMSFY